MKYYVIKPMPRQRKPPLDVWCRIGFIRWLWYVAFTKKKTGTSKAWDAMKAETAKVGGLK